MKITVVTFYSFRKVFELFIIVWSFYAENLWFNYCKEHITLSNLSCLLRKPHKYRKRKHSAFMRLISALFIHTAVTHKHNIMAFLDIVKNLKKKKKEKSTGLENLREILNKLCNHHKNTALFIKAFSISETSRKTIHRSSIMCRTNFYPASINICRGNAQIYPPS